MGGHAANGTAGGKRPRGSALLPARTPSPPGHGAGAAGREEGGGGPQPEPQQEPGGAAPPAEAGRMRGAGKGGGTWHRAVRKVLPEQQVLRVVLSRFHTCYRTTLFSVGSAQSSVLRLLPVNQIFVSLHQFPPHIELLVNFFFFLCLNYLIGSLNI